MSASPPTVKIFTYDRCGDKYAIQVPAIVDTDGLLTVDIMVVKEADKMLADAIMHRPPR
jgi:hypothetical protein